MNLNQTLLPEFDIEMANTRKTLERLPQDKWDWTPHEKSMTLQGLASHMANLPIWGEMAVREDGFDVAPKDGEPFSTPQLGSPAEVLSAFDTNIAAARAALESASNEVLMGPWSLLQGGETLFTMPRMAVLRSFVMNHMIHHRAQLGVYLRINDVPLPSVYGPTADEQM